MREKTLADVARAQNLALNRRVSRIFHDLRAKPLTRPAKREGA